MIFHGPLRTAAVNSRIRDPAGTAIALVAGILVGTVVSVPMLPRTVPVVEATVSPIGAALLVGSLAVVAVSLGVVLLYLSSMRLER